MIRMRDDLAEEEMLVPAFDDVLDNHETVGVTYLSAEDLIGAEVADGNDDDTHPRWEYNYIQLKDGRKFYMIGADLDWGEEIPT